MDRAKLISKPSFVEGILFFIQKPFDKESKGCLDEALDLIRKELPKEFRRTFKSTTAIMEDCGEYPDMVGIQVPTPTEEIKTRIISELRRNGWAFGLYEQLTGGGIARCYKPKFIPKWLKNVKADQEPRPENTGRCAGCNVKYRPACEECQDEAEAFEHFMELTTELFNTKTRKIARQKLEVAAISKKAPDYHQKRLNVIINLPH